MEKTLLYAITGFLIAEFLLQRWLDMINLKHWKNEIPDEMKGFINEERYEKIQEYEKAKKRLSLLTGTVTTAVMIIFLTTGMFGRLYEFIADISSSEYVCTLLYFGILLFINVIISLPFSVYNTFVIEEEFGFNRYTLGLFIADKCKSLLLSVIIGGSILSILLFIYTQAGPWFWALAWITVSLILLFFLMFYTTLIVPLFNRLTPLDEGLLKRKIEAYAEKVQFPIQKIMIIDGSKRSAKSNAFFSGIGSKKTVVLFDTLVAQHTEDELVAVIAHEVGHYKKKHILKNYLLSFIQSGVICYLLGLALNEPLFSRMLGANQPSFAVGLTGFMLLYQPVSFVVGILTGVLSRKFEFEADAFARETFDGIALSNALKKLSVANLSNLQPHPLYVFFHYSHPPVLERLKALKS